MLQIEKDSAHLKKSGKNQGLLAVIFNEADSSYQVSFLQAQIKSKIDFERGLRGSLAESTARPRLHLCGLIYLSDSLTGRLLTSDPGMQQVVEQAAANSFLAGLQREKPRLIFMAMRVLSWLTMDHDNEELLRASYALGRQSIDRRPIQPPPDPLGVLAAEAIFLADTVKTIFCRLFYKQ